MTRFNLTKYTIYFYFELKNSYFVSWIVNFDNKSMIYFHKMKFNKNQFKNNSRYKKIYE